MEFPKRKIKHSPPPEGCPQDGVAFCVGKFILLHQYSLENIQGPVYKVVCCISCF